MNKYSLMYLKKEEIIDYIYHSKKVSRDNEVIWAVLYENFINDNGEWADIFMLDDTKTYLAIIATLEDYYIKYFHTFEEAQKWAIETLQTKANFKVDLTKYQN